MNASPPDLTRLRIDRSEPARSGGRSWRVVVPVLVVVLGLGGIAIAFLGPRPPEVTVAIAEATGGGTVSGSGITANGYVVARTKASVSAKVPGRMAYLGVSEGSTVRIGEIIARLENADYQAALLAARAAVAQTEVQLAQARRDLARTRALKDANLVADAEVENAQAKVDGLAAGLEVARAQARYAEANVENTNVRAPFDGTVLRKDAEVGEIVAPSSAGGGLTRTAIVTMADLRTLEVEVDVNEAYIAQVRNGESARITLDAYPDTSFAGRVRQVVPTADRQKATVQVKVAILDRDPRILPEMGAKVEFLRPEHASGPIATAPVRVLAPANAVITSGAGATVWIVSGERAESRAVEVGPAHGDRVEIRKGLSGGERVIVGAPASLKSGERVRVKGA
ncbi:MAG: efflux RND transporter periplasmic adaptor subunit [Candidatus Eisenbacteria bacterium]|uniref:Efflux RND transporter periplasmic adaptor subunit n=1 Tax=Eiseniibacteriota bacterium TaxID=2212470 RepID=A0A9D6QKP9_UNCEI|nr:efflux RND transporter periplasmic adaptor subunit [Candidatus Eisenbacteria bacterium]MBI3540500.1 efflux RND transporter periplasmic adaptor subunit [Candidatus Eisenbacteria bacterium]